jgi:hypothetical protein
VMISKTPRVHRKHMITSQDERSICCVLDAYALRRSATKRV